ncbi:hypothetical protein DY468_13275 [Rhodopseudomonas sp. BR0M22]|nr:hypothetical protein [Rhodopseudomonas sp. BR0M22]
MVGAAEHREAVAVAIVNVGDAVDVTALFLDADELGRGRELSENVGYAVEVGPLLDDLVRFRKSMVLAIAASVWTLAFALGGYRLAPAEIP